MKAIQKITIKGQEREAIFTLRLFSYADEHGIKVEIPTAETLKRDPMAWVEPYINIIYIGLLTGCERAGVEPDFDRYDVEAWATENQREFVRLVRGLIRLLTSGKNDDDEQSSAGASCDAGTDSCADVCKKKRSPWWTTTKSKVS